MKTINLIAIFACVFSGVISFIKDDWGETLAWLTAALWAISSRHFESKEEELKKLSDLTPDDEEFGKFIREIYKK